MAKINVTEIDVESIMDQAVVKCMSVVHKRLGLINDGYEPYPEEKWGDEKTVSTPPIRRRKPL